MTDERDERDTERPGSGAPEAPIPPGAMHTMRPVNQSDRRENARAPITLKVEYKRLNSFFADYTKNISRGGTFIETQKPLPIGTEFHFELHIPKLPDPIRLRGKVQWTVDPEDVVPEEEQGPGMGIGFVYGDAAERARIDSLVEGLMRESLGPVLFAQLLDKNER